MYSYKLSEKVLLLLFNLPKAKAKTRMVFFLSLFLESLFFIHTYTKAVVLKGSYFTAVFYLAALTI